MASKFSIASFRGNAQETPKPTRGCRLPADSPSPSPSSCQHAGADLPPLPQLCQLRLHAGELVGDLGAAWRGPSPRSRARPSPKSPGFESFFSNLAASAASFAALLLETGALGGEVHQAGQPYVHFQPRCQRRRWIRAGFSASVAIDQRRRGSPMPSMSYRRWASSSSTSCLIRPSRTPPAPSSARCRSASASCCDTADTVLGDHDDGALGVFVHIAVQGPRRRATPRR